MDTLEMRVLRRALELLGTERALARQLQVPLPILCAWLKGEEIPPRTKFLDAVDIILDDGDCRIETELPTTAGPRAKSEPRER